METASHLAQKTETLYQILGLLKVPHRAPQTAAVATVEILEETAALEAAALEAQDKAQQCQIWVLG